MFGRCWGRIDGCGVVDAGREGEGRVGLDGVANGDYSCLFESLLAVGVRESNAQRIVACSGCEGERTNRSHCGRRPGVEGRRDISVDAMVGYSSRQFYFETVKR